MHVVHFKTERNTMEQFEYNKLQTHDTTEYYVMSDKEYRRLTNHILTVTSTLLERNTIKGKRETQSDRQTRLDILTKDRYHRKSSLHNEAISMLDAICGLLQKINRKANNDLTTKQVAFFNQILKDFGKDWIGNDMALSGDFIDMVTIKDTAQNTAFGNGLFELN